MSHVNRPILDVNFTINEIDADIGSRSLDALKLD